jgi:ABC-type branched-subunit amino acid transport system substrate-binding protein
MTRQFRIARAFFAPGRFLVLALGLVVGCQVSPGAGEGTPEPPSFPDPVLSEGPTDPSGEERAVVLFAQAREALEWGRLAEARDFATQIVERYPSAPVSGRALFLLAQAALGSDDLEVAAEAAARFAQLVEPGDPRGGEARLLESEALEGLGDPSGQLSSLLAIGPGATTNALIRGAEDARRAASQLTRGQIEAILAQTAGDGPLLPVALARYAGLVHLDGDEEEARQQAQAAIDAGARGADSVMAADILSGRGPGFQIARSTVRIATVLPEGGSPAFRRFSRLIAEGVDVAAATYLGEATRVEVVSMDDGGDPATAATLVRELESGEALGAVGFLEDGALDAAAQGRLRMLPLVSPTSRTANGEGVYTLSGADPQAAASIARYVAREQYERVAVVHSQAPESVEEADAFQAVLQNLGVPVVGRFSYPMGATFFREQVREAEASLRRAEIRALRLGPNDTLRADMLEKVALFLPLPPEDVELLAPQVTFYGLDTLAVDIVGTSGWTDPQTLETVDVRHTTGVVATASEAGGSESPGYRRFQEAYESHYQRTLVSSVPALGYDAALLLLEAAREGARTPTQLRFELERIRDLEGATGTFSILGRRLVRSTRLVRIEHGALIPIG